MGEDQQRALLGWFAEYGRDLPWRASRDPWAILVSEFMLQQTQVDRVIDRFPPFLASFPTPVALARSPVAEVISRWSGLGYNRRAVNLHRAAMMIDQSHAGQVPGDLDALLALPGVGPYTARAVRVFAFERADGVVDTNSGRVLARSHGRRLTPGGAQRLADSLVPPDEPWMWNQAMIELGALLCRSDPSCHRCPIRSSCDWFVGGCVEPDPAHRSASVSRRQSRFAGSDRQGRGRLLAGLRAGPVSASSIPGVMGWPDDPARSIRVADSLVADGLARRVEDRFELP